MCSPTVRSSSGSSSGSPRQGSPIQGSPTWYRTWAAAGLATALLVTIVRLWTARGRDEFSLWPDEPAQLAMARFIGGGVPWTMHDHSTWQPGYATVLAPVHLFTDDPVAVFHAALALNAVLGGIAAGLVVLLVRRLTALDPWTGAAIASIVALAPAALFTTEFVWSESLVLVLFPATLLALLRFDDSPTMANGALAAVLASLAFGTHSRMMPLAVATIAVAVVAVVQRRATLRIGVVVATGTVVAMVAVRLYAGFVFDRLWDTPSTTNSLGGMIDHLGAPGTILIALAGQAWYLLVATVGIVLYGTLVLARSALGAAVDGPGTSAPGHDSVQSPTARRDAVVVVLVVGACLATSVLFMAGRLRPDQVVYGRYNDAVITPVVAIGVAFLLREPSVRRRAASTIGALVATTACASIVLAWRRGALEEGNGLEPMILGLQPFIAHAGSIDVVAISVAALAIIAVVGLIGALGQRIERPAVVLIAVAVLVVAGSFRTATVIDDGWRGRGDLSAVGALAAGVLADGVDVDFLLPDGTSSDRLMLYQLYLPANRFTVVEDLDDGTSRFVFAPIDDPELREVSTLEWTDPRRNYGLWER